VARKPDVLYALGLTIHPLTGRFVPRLDWLPRGPNEEGEEEMEEDLLGRAEPVVRVIPIARRLVRRAKEHGS
jgi:hypothetical protein